jgi:hypothetical protein
VAGTQVIAAPKPAGQVAKPTARATGATAPKPTTQVAVVPTPTLVRPTPTSVPKPAGGLVASALTPQVVAPAGATPADTIRLFYGLISKRDFVSAWSLLSPRAQNDLKGFNTWTNGFVNTQSVEVDAITSKATASSATVSVAIRSHDVTPNAVAVTKIYQGTWDMIASSTGWKLDVANIKQVG